ncbi:MAG: FAD:protein FMN transferase [Thermoleophilia bacterium]|nr:FAD:protein FMN transferase [Thermoleophilia bacterium]
MTAAALEEARFRSMGTDVRVVVAGDAGPAGAAVRGLFVHWEATLSRFLPASDVARTSVGAGGFVRVSALAVRVVAAACAAARETAGLYDPCLGRAMRAIGYDRSWRERGNWADGPRDAGSPGGAWRGVETDAGGRRIRLPAGAELDLGGIAKGMAVDEAVAMLTQRGVRACLVSAGGDLAVAGTPPGQDGWDLALPDAAGLHIRLHEGAVATSGTTRRAWTRGGARVHHVIDPRTGMPTASGLRGVSVIAAGCAHAEVAATAALVGGAREGRRFLERRGFAALLVHDDGHREPVGAWPRGAAA